MSHNVDLPKSENPGEEPGSAEIFGKNGRRSWGGGSLRLNIWAKISFHLGAQKKMLVFYNGNRDGIFFFIFFLKVMKNTSYWKQKLSFYSDFFLLLCSNGMKMEYICILKTKQKKI